MQTRLGNQQLDASIDFASAGPQTLNYNGDGSLNYVETVVQGETFRQTFTYTSGVVTGISAWVKQ